MRIQEPMCPACGAANKHLEYVFDIVEFAKVDAVDDLTAHAGEVYESADVTFHHISCSACGKYWESNGEFVDACKKTYGE